MKKIKLGVSVFMLVLGTLTFLAGTDIYHGTEPDLSSEWFIFSLFFYLSILYIIFNLMEFFIDKKDKKEAEEFILEESEKGTELSRKLNVEKQENLKKLSQYLERNSKITNDEVEKILGVSHTSAYRYLEELEGTGQIRQVGKTGTAVYYEKI